MTRPEQKIPTHEKVLGGMFLLCLAFLVIDFVYTPFRHNLKVTIKDQKNQIADLVREKVALRKVVSECLNDNVCSIALTAIPQRNHHAFVIGHDGEIILTCQQERDDGVVSVYDVTIPVDHELRDWSVIKMMVPSFVKKRSIEDCFPKNTGK